MEKKRRFNLRILIINAVSVLLIITGFYILADRFVINNQSDTDAAQETYELPMPPELQEVKQRTQAIDLAGVELTKTMKRFGFNMGFLSSNFVTDLGFSLPVEVENTNVEVVEGDDISQYGIPEPLEDITPAPQNPEFRNQFIWQQYGIEAPIQYASFEDIFERNESGDFIFDKYVNNDPIDSPVQIKLRDGIVHLPFSPSPGEVGNSYIIGHSSNYSSVDSDYNFIFEPIIEKVSIGESFTIYDNLGRELTFEVIETKVVRQEEVGEAYQKFEDKRTVTLQGSILEETPSGWLPTKRYLVIGELKI